MKRVKLVAAICCVLASPAMADDAKPNPRAVLERANAAAAKLNAISYDAKFYGEGVMAKNIPTMQGHVIAHRGAMPTRPKVRLDGELTPPGGDTPIKFKFASDGMKAFRIDDEKKQFLTGDAATLKSTEMSGLIPPKYFVDAPYKGELDLQDITHAGVEKIDGVDCDVIEIIYDASTGRKMTYWLGAKDGLLRKVQNIMAVRVPGKTEPETGRIVFETSRFDAQPKIDEQTFALFAPEGYQSQVIATPEFGPDGLLAAGRPAPDWELKDFDGKTVRLKDLRGKVVLMDFWASWCGPCKMVMPGMQAIHEKFKDKPVVICGVNCRERAETAPAARQFVKDKKLTYTQLINGDEVAKAYHVRGIPCMYVIGPDGNIIYATSGYQPTHEQMFTKFIEETLKSMPSEAATKVSVK
ncbi:MAG: TlpA family protein disulfide reductase [Planctomycetia bacterium]|nr:TlpA family protein disulfide reductase [Planctomycetia bacterium]MCC7315082.1 TlpA family protein disulfide reductase [Planctomycetota bacterium]